MAPLPLDLLLIFGSLYDVGAGVWTDRPVVTISDPLGFLLGFRHCLISRGGCLCCQIGGQWAISSLFARGAALSDLRGGVCVARSAGSGPSARCLPEVRPCLISEVGVCVARSAGSGPPSARCRRPCWRASSSWRPCSRPPPSSAACSAAR